MVSDEKLIAGLHDEAVTYLEKKAQAIKAIGVDKVSYNAEYGERPGRGQWGRRR
jgi:hypothetical protein